MVMKNSRAALTAGSMTDLRGVDMTHNTCSVDGCGIQSRSANSTWCEKHYMKNYRHGSPTYVHTSRPRVDLTGRRFGSLVVVQFTNKWWHLRCDCGATRTAKTNTLMAGQAVACNNHRIHKRTSNPTYDTVHGWVTFDRGPAGKQVCVDCGRPAQHWSYNHQDKDELTSTTERTMGLPYSKDVYNYQPRCVPCHKAFDLSRIGSITR
jgi:hypothetical protein